jgi:2-octaprenylphenol hydroxylase
MTTKYDIAIVGAGIVGLSAALSLANAGFQIVVFDQLTPDLEPHDDYDLRTVALNPSAKALLQKIQVWKQVPTSKIGIMHNMQVWDQQGQGNIQFDADTAGIEAISFVVENRELVKALYMEAKKNKNITLKTPFVLNTLETLRTYADLIIAADGKNSWTREQLNIKVTIRDYQHKAVVSIIETKKPHKNTAFQVFLDKGPIGLLPMANPHHMSMVWSTTPYHAEQLVNSNDKEFNCTLSNAFDLKQGLMKSITPRVSIPLAMQHANTYLAPGAVLIGDAAHSIHPLAGQGANLGLSDVACLTRCLLNAKNKDQSISAQKILRPFERERKTKNADMICLMRSFKEVFSSQNKAVKTLCSLALNTANKSDFLKKYFMQFAG